MKRLFSFLLTIVMATVCYSQVRQDLTFQKIEAKNVTDMAVVQHVPYQQLQGYEVNNPNLLMGELLLYIDKEQFDQDFTATKKSQSINFDTHFVVVVSPNVLCKCKKFKVEDVFYNNSGQIIVKSFAKCDEYRTLVTSLKVNPDGSKVAVGTWEGKPYARAIKEQPYILITIAKANNGNVAHSCLKTFRSNEKWIGTKEEKKEIYELQKQGKYIFEE